MKRSIWILIGLFVGAGAATAGEAEMMRELQQLGSRAERELAQVESRAERERIKINRAFREARSKLERELQANIAQAASRLADGDQSSAGALGGLMGMGPAAAKQVYEEAALTARRDYEDLMEVEFKAEAERNVINRRNALESARVAARHLDVSGDNAEEQSRFRDLMIKTAEITERWQVKIDALNLDEKRAVNAAELEGRLTEAGIQREMAEWLASKVNAVKDGGQIFNMLGDPEYLALQAKIDDVRNTIQTKAESLAADFADKRSELEFAHEDELAANATP